MATYSDATNDELWRECATWLTQWQMIRKDHKVNWPESKIADFANILRDGVILCKLLNKIDEGCLDMKDVNLKTTMAQFLCLRNIKVFLKTCERSFGLKQSDLFEAPELFDLSNFHKVLCTLSKISLSPKALKSNIPGFTAQRFKNGDEVIYQSLKSVDMTRRSRTIEPDYDMADDIYQDLGLLQVEPQPTLMKRDYVIKELLDTEKNYVEVLTKLKKNFMIPLQPLMKNPEEHETVFFKIDELLQIHVHFLEELNKTKTNPSVKLGDIFIRWKEKFLVYGQYCVKLSKAIATLQERCDNDEFFNQCVIKFEKQDNNGRFKLRDVLAVPMQRILKYHLLLEKLIENTERHHEEHRDLVRAKETMMDVACYINEAVRDNDHLTVIKSLEEKINVHLNLSQYGRLIKDCELKVKYHGPNIIKTRYVFIFVKEILLCKQLKTNQFEIKDYIDLKHYNIQHLDNTQFYLVQNDRSHAYTIIVKNPELKTQIIKSIEDALEVINPTASKSTTHKLDITTFDQPMQCHHCSKYLKGLIFQGYRCQVCGIVVHQSCIGLTGRCGSHNSVEANSLPMVNGFCDSDDPLADKLWFVGEMDRETASSRLARREVGTFLVRIRPHQDKKGKYALSLKTGNVKHMIIYEGEEQTKYYLSLSKYFSSIENLVLNYAKNSLRENFDSLSEDTMLLWPIRQEEATVLKGFEAGADRDEMNLREGSKVIVIGKEGYLDGWWKGRNEVNEVGYFPKKYVRVERMVMFD